MGLVTIPNRPAGTDVRSIEQILADFDAILTGAVNGHIDATNMEPSFLNSLLKSAGGGPFKIQVSSFTLTWSGTIDSNILTISHAIGAVPLGVFFQCHETGNPSIVPVAQYSGLTSTQFFVSAVSQGAGSYSVPFNWLAFG
jgi:hypothetical protein